MRDPRLTEIDALKIRFSQIFVAMAVGAIAAQVSHLSGGGSPYPQARLHKNRNVWKVLGR